MPNPDQDISGFAAKIKKYLISVDLTLESLAEDLAIHPTTLGYWIHGDYRKLKRGEKISLSPEKVKQVIAALARKEAIVTVAEALELLALALPDRPRLHKFNKTDQKTDWFRELCANELDGATPYTAHRQPLRTEPKNGKSKATEEANIGSNSNIAPLPPKSANGLVGREAEIEQLIEMLTYPDSKVRLVTLKGMGGIGKTRLGLEVLHRLVEPVQGDSISTPVFPDGVLFAPLVSANSTELLIASILQVIGLKPAASGSEVTPRERLMNFLANKHMILMLDNFEQFLAGVTGDSNFRSNSVNENFVAGGSGELEENPRLFVNNLLRTAPNVKLLITSRERLRIQGEQAFEVKSLGCPTLLVNEAETSKETPATIMQKYPAVKLFVDRAKSEDANFRLTAENMRDVCSICYYLDGIPQAIELAAARNDEFNPAVMLATFFTREHNRVDGVASRKRSRSPLRLLATKPGAYGLPERHQTIEKTLDWSYELLTKKEQMIFRRLAVFEGGFDIEAVAEVCAEAIREREVEIIISSLVSKSLIKPASSEGEARYFLLVTSQDYGWYQLENTGELETVREQHANYFLRLAREAEPHLTEAGRVTSQEKLGLEYSNLIATLRFFIEKQKTSEATELGGILGYLWVKSGAKNNYLQEGREWLERVINLAENSTHTPAVFLARVLHHLGKFATLEKKSIEAKFKLQQAITYWREANNKKGLALSLISLGNICYAQSNFTEAEKLYAEAEILASELKDRFSLSSCLQNLGNIAVAKENLVIAKVKYETALELKRQVNNLPSVAILTKNLATIAIKNHDLDKAEVLSKESIEINQALGTHANKIENLFNLARIAYLRDNKHLAVSFYKEGLGLAIELSTFRQLTFALIHITSMLIKSAEKENLLAASKLSGAVGEWLKANETKADTDDKNEYNTNITTLKQTLNPKTLAKYWAEGIALAGDMRQVALNTISMLK